MLPTPQITLSRWSLKVCNLLRLALFTQHDLPGDSSKWFPVPIVHSFLSIVHPFYGRAGSHVMGAPQPV